MIVDLAARIVLLPVLLGQAITTKFRTPNLPEPDGPRSGVVGQGPRLRLLIIGDSSAAGVGVGNQSDALLGQVLARLQDDYEVKFDLVAETGARTSDVLSWLPGLPAARYDVVVTALGVNDVTKGRSLKMFLRQQERLIDQCQRSFDTRLILVSGLPPVDQFPALPNPLRWALGWQAQRFDRHLDQLVQGKSGVQKLQFDMALNQSAMATDGFHPGSKVYARWAARVVEQIKLHHAQLDLAQPAP